MRAATFAQESLPVFVCIFFYAYAVTSGFHSFLTWHLT